MLAAINLCNIHSCFLHYLHSCFKRMVLLRSAGAEGMSSGTIPRASSKADRLYQMCPEWDHPNQESRQTKRTEQRRATKEHSRTNKSLNIRPKSRVLQAVLQLLGSALRWVVVIVIALLLLSATVQNEKKETSNILEPEQHTWQVTLLESSCTV